MCALGAHCRVTITNSCTLAGDDTTSIYAAKTQDVHVHVFNLVAPLGYNAFDVRAQASVIS